jgi:hypothetical protein
MFRTYLTILVVLSLIMAGISPACARMRGDTILIEICSAMGISTIALPADSGLKGQIPSQSHLDKKCAFCLHFASGGLIFNSKEISHPQEFDREYVFPIVIFHTLTTYLNAHPPRGPPAA